MRRSSDAPPRGGVTRSRYVPAWTVTVSPGWAARAAAEMVWYGWDGDPSLASFPFTETCHSRAAAACATNASSASEPKCRIAGAASVCDGRVGVNRGDGLFRPAYFE